jgi:F-type H+-transporting ATPase subunit gamma
MSNTTASLSRKITSAGDLQSVVRTMKALAASSIGQYQESVRTLADYYHTVELGLGAIFRQSGLTSLTGDREGSGEAGAICAIVFGSDQGLVGQFNETVADFALKTLGDLPGEPQVWAVGERVQSRLGDTGLALAGTFPVPSSVQAITPLVGRIQIESEANRAMGEVTRDPLLRVSGTVAVAHLPHRPGSSRRDSMTTGRFAHHLSFMSVWDKCPVRVSLHNSMIVCSSWRLDEPDPPD